MITDLPEEIASRTPQPPFEAVVTRVREDRRRTLRRTAIGAASLAVAALLVVPYLGGASTDRQPSDHGPSTVSELFARPDVSVVQVGGSDDGGVAALWQGCTDDPADCGYAVLTSGGGRVLVDSPVLSPTPSGWLVHTVAGWQQLTSDGEVSEVSTEGAGGVRAGDEAVETAGGLGLLRGDQLLLLPSASGSATQAYVTPQGRLLEVTATGDGSLRLRASVDGKHWTTLRSWEPGTGVAQVRLAGYGRSVAAVTTGDGPGGDRTIEQVDLSHDGGRTWTTARGIDFGNEVRDLSGIAVSPQGSVYLTTGSDGLIRIDPDGNAQRTPIYVQDRWVFTTAYDVCVLTQPRQADLPEVVSCSGNDGTSWADERVPGSALVNGG
jgi:hypothetical protein